MDQLQTILTLPFEIVAAMAAGYLGYRLAYVGRDQTHKTIDVVFITAVFAFFALLIGRAVHQAGCPLPWPQLVGIIGTLGCAATWRAQLSDLTLQLLRTAKISTSDHHLTAWDNIRTDAKSRISCVIILLKDGSAVMSANLGLMGRLPHGPCIFGADGSIALYITHHRAAGQTDWQDEPAVHNEWGHVLTCLSADQIAERRVYYAFSGPALAAEWLA